MDTSRVPVVVPMPPDDVVIRLTYLEAQYLRGILNFFDRMGKSNVFRGTIGTLLRVKSFANKLDRCLSNDGVAHFTDVNYSPKVAVDPRD